jgi:hypothetical protein
MSSSLSKIGLNTANSDVNLPQNTEFKTIKKKMGEEEARKLIRRTLNSVENSIKGSDSVLTIKGIPIKGNLLYFFSLVMNDQALHDKLKAETDKGKLLKLLVELGKKNDCKFTEQDVEAIPGSWQAQSAQQLLSVFLNLAKGSIEQFLVTVKNNPPLQEKLMEAFLDKEKVSLEQFATDFQDNPAWQKKLRMAPNKESFVKQAVDLGNQNCYQFTDKEVQAIPGSWQAQSVEDLLSLLLNLKKGSLENYIDKETAQKQFVQVTMDLAKENGYCFLEEEEKRLSEVLSKGLADAWNASYERGRIWS